MKKQPTDRSAWASFKYKVLDGGATDGSPVARRIKAALASAQTPHGVTREIETGVMLMMLAAGLPDDPDVPLEIRYLAAHQRLQYYHGAPDQVLATRATVDRLLALCRASNLVDDALDGLKKRPETVTAERIAALIEAPETPRVVRELLQLACESIDTFAAPRTEVSGGWDINFQFPKEATPALIRRKLPKMLRRVGDWRLADWQGKDLEGPDEKGGAK
jgi:hypothetical protein